MAKLEKLLTVLRNSEDKDLLEMADNLESNRKEQLANHEKYVDESYLFTLDYDIDTDWDFYIGGDSNPRGTLKSSTREGLIEKCRRYFIEEADYCNSDRVSAFKEHYISEALEYLKKEDGWTTGGNWEMSFYITPPPNQNKAFNPMNPPLTVGGIDFE